LGFNKYSKGLSNAIVTIYKEEGVRNGFFKGGLVSSL
jgi:hypothetical protein